MVRTGNGLSLSGNIAQFLVRKDEIMKVELNANKVMIGLGKAGEIEVDIAKLAASEAVVNYVFNYGLKQMLNDVHASEKDLAAKVGLSQKKLDSLYRGEVAQARIGGVGVPVEKVLRLFA